MAEDLEERVPVRGLMDCDVGKDETPLRVRIKRREQEERERKEGRGPMGLMGLMGLMDLWERGKRERESAQQG